jgi:hypothetical protein
MTNVDVTIPDRGSVDFILLDGGRGPDFDGRNIGRTGT